MFEQAHTQLIFDLWHVSEQRAVARSDDYAKDRTAQDLEGCVTNEFFELFLISEYFVEVLELVNHFVQEFCLLSGLPTDADGVVHYDEREEEGHGKFKASQSVGNKRCAAQSTDSGRM